MIRLSTNQFKWSTIEQVYPHEVDINGNPLYAKQSSPILLGGGGGYIQAHGIVNYGYTHRFSGQLTAGASRQILPWFDAGTPANNVDLRVDSTNISVYHNGAWNGWTATAYLIYSKS